MAFELKYPTVCYDCGQDIKVGTQARMVNYASKDIAHVICPPKPEVCTHCFTELPKSGICDCRT